MDENELCEEHIPAMGAQCGQVLNSDPEPWALTIELSCYPIIIHFDVDGNEPSP